MESDKQKNQIKVFFCDYGNTEVISKESFTHIDEKFWKLPPQAIPVKLHGLEYPVGVDSHNLQQGVAFLEEHCYGKIIEAKVIEERREPRAHIIELTDVKVPGLAPKSLEDVLIERKFLVRKDMNKTNVGTASKEYDGQHVIEKSMRFRTTISLFKYDMRNLLKAQILAVESPSLFYWRVEDSNQQFVELKKKLCKFLPKEKAEISVGKLVCLREDDENIRVRILDLACNYTYSKQVLVFDMDSGKKMWAVADHLYVLDSEFEQMNAIVQTAALAGIETCSRVTDATSMLRCRIGKESFLNLLDKDSQGKFYVELFNEDVSSSINCEMIEQGNAKVAISNPDMHNDTSESLQMKLQGRRSSLTSNVIPAVSCLEMDSPFTLPSKEPPIVTQKTGAEFCNVGMTTYDANSKPEQSSAARSVGVNNSRKHFKRYSSRKDLPGNSKSSSESSDTFSDDPASVRSKHASQRASARYSRNSKRKQRNPERQRNGHVCHQDSSVSGNSTRKSTEAQQQSDVITDVTAAIPNGESNKKAGDFSVGSDCTERFRPQTPPLPPLIDIQPDDYEQTPSRDLLSFITEIAKENDMKELIKFKANGTLDREAIDLEMKHWRVHKNHLEKYRETLNEMLNLPIDKANAQIIRNKKKRLEIHVRSMESEKLLKELENDLKDMRIEYSGLHNS